MSIFPLTADAGVASLPSSDFAFRAPAAMQDFPPELELQLGGSLSAAIAAGPTAVAAGLVVLMRILPPLLLLSGCARLRYPALYHDAALATLRYQTIRSRYHALFRYHVAELCRFQLKPELGLRTQMISYHWRRTHTNLVSMCGLQRR